MGDYCTAKGFFRKPEGMGGSRVSPEMITSRDVYCEKCKVKANKTKSTPKTSSSMTGRGRCIYHWNEVEIKCPLCGNIGVVDEDEHEEDGNYYSNEYRRVYRI